MIVNPNLSAQVSLNNLQANETLAKSLSRLSAGGSAVSSADAGADPALIVDLQTQISSVDGAQQQVGNAVSFTQTQDSYLRQASVALDRMSELARLACHADSDGERTQYQGEFSQLSASVSDTSTTDFNGASLFSGNTLDVPTDAGGATLTLPGVDLSASAYTGALNASLTSAPDAQHAFYNVTGAMIQLSQDRATVGSSLSRLDSAANQLAVSRENLNAADSGIQDADAAEQTTLSARQNILAQSGAAMLAQANAMPQSALRLLP
jgi:flagellin